MEGGQSNCSGPYPNISNTTCLESPGGGSSAGYGSPEFIAGMSTFYITIIAASFVGYGFIYLSVFLNPRLRTFCNCFILSLGLADVITVSSVLPVNVGLLLNTFQFTSAFQCDFIASLNLISISAVAFNLCAVSLERYFSISYPFKYEIFMSVPTIAGSIGGIWLYAFISGMLPQMGWRDQPTLVHRGFCLRDNVPSYTLFITVCNFCVPAVVLITSNVLVYRIATSHARRVFRNLPGSVNQNMESLRKNYRAAKRISLIVGVYLVCWLPHMTVLIIGLAVGARNIPLEVYPVTLSLQYLSSAINPCLFCLTNRELRETVKRTLHARLRLKRSSADIHLTADEMSLAERHHATRASQATETSRI